MINIYVGNLHREATEDDVRNAFENFGDVNSVNLITDRETGQSRGFAFVEMNDRDRGRQAIDELNLAEIAGRRVTVNEARPKPDTKGRSSGPRRRRR